MKKSMGKRVASWLVVTVLAGVAFGFIASGKFESMLGNWFPPAEAVASELGDTGETVSLEIPTVTEGAKVPDWVNDPKAAAAKLESGRKAKYVFLFIGDGMAVPQRMLTDKFLKETGRGELLINTLPVQGMTTTSSASSFITDSAAAGTAIACGTKTNKDFLGVDKDNNTLESVAEVAKKSGRKVGVISSVFLNDATPAAFYAHTNSRKNKEAIVNMALESDYDFFGGSRFDPGTVGGKSIYDTFAEKGYQVVNCQPGEYAAKLDALVPGKAVAVTGFGPALDNAAAAGNLAAVTAAAIKVMDNPAGFFLMVEGGYVDWICHRNDAGGVISEIAAFDNAVREAYKFAEAHPGEVLIIVTGDHETGSLTLGGSNMVYDSNIKLLDAQKKSTEGGFCSAHKAMKAPSFDAIKPLITRDFGLKFESDDAKDPLLLTEREVALLQQAYRYEVERKDNVSPTTSDIALFDKRVDWYCPIAISACKILADKAGLGWTSFYHSALPVWTSSYGVGSQQFGGMIDNTDIAKGIKKELQK